MHKTPIIKRFLAALMLVIFALGITPKKLLHDLVANHKDKSASTLDNTGTPKIYKAAFNCNCDNLVAESPFTSDHADIAFVIPSVFAERSSFPVVCFYAARHFIFGLRGPPAGV